MPGNMFTPELFRPEVDYPVIPYDHLLRTAAERNPDGPAIVYHDLTLVYREVVSIVNSVANSLLELGIRKGDRICLCTGNRPESTITLNAASTIGAIITPMNPLYKEREMAYQLANSEARAILIRLDMLPILQTVLSQQSLPNLKHIFVLGKDVPESMPEALPFARLLKGGSAKRPAPVEISGDDMIVLTYSSGTTGLPKGTMLSHHNLATNHLQFLTDSRINASDTTLIFVPFYHIYGVLLTGSFLAAGAKQVIMDRFELDPVLETCAKHGPSWLFAVPAMVQTLANAPGDLNQLSTVKYLMSAAAPLPLAPAKKLQERTGLRIIQAYGMTETCPITHLSPLEPELMKLGSAGLPMNNTEQKIVDVETGEQELPVGEDGEIIIRGPQVMLGYWGDPEETALTLRNGWIHTGDIGHLDTEGYLYIVDRKKDMIKYKAFSIAPAELEAVLAEHPAVQESAVVGVPDEEAGEIPKAFVILHREESGSVTDEELITFVNGKLTGYKKLREVEFVETLPKLPSGKILRRELKALERARRAGSQ
ncbi:MAG TPA: AMP-binding protein [Ktedonobacteraceae bacterium]|nr:AMP-binding protein [Ktedonobacteraceae bacterium]